MSKHLVFSLRTSLEQSFTLPLDLDLKSFSLKMYMHNYPSGNFKASIHDGISELASKTLSIAEINNGITTEGKVTPAKYMLGWINFEIPKIIKLRRAKQYYVKLELSGATFNTNSWIGWIKEHESETNKIIPAPAYDSFKTLSFRLWGLRYA